MITRRCNSSNRSQRRRNRGRKLQLNAAATYYYFCIIIALLLWNQWRQEKDENFSWKLSIYLSFYLSIYLSIHRPVFSSDLQAFKEPRYFTQLTKYQQLCCMPLQRQMGRQCPSETFWPFAHWTGHHTGHWSELNRQRFGTMQHGLIKATHVLLRSTLPTLNISNHSILFRFFLFLCFLFIFFNLQSATCPWDATNIYPLVFRPHKELPTLSESQLLSGSGDAVSRHYFYTSRY